MLTPLLEEWDTDLRSGDPLTFPGYADKIEALDHESVRTGVAGSPGRPYVLIEGDFSVIGGSMGLVHGEKVVRAFDRATEFRLPVVVVTRSGGARMQEGMVSLIQMARTAAAVERHRGAGLLSIAVHRSPTTGGVFASYGSLADLRVVEHGATIGFAGPRVVEQTTGQDVDGRSHSSETAADAGLVDDLVEGDQLLAWVETALGMRKEPLIAPAVTADQSRTTGAGAGAGASAGTGAESGKAGQEGAEVNDAWRSVVAARDPHRPSGIQVAAALVDSWTELGCEADPALRAGLASIGDHRVIVIANDRHAGTGRPTPDGFRLAQRAIGLAGRLGLPIVSLIDTPGAEPGPDAENDGIAGEIARTFAAFSTVGTPTVAVCVGEGGSGGALAIGATDRLLVQEHAIFSVIGPEGAAAILERDAHRAATVAPLLRLTSSDLVELGIVDAVIPDGVAATVSAIRAELADLTGPARAQVTVRRRERNDLATRHWLR